jgi:hypothetical protein
MHTYFLVAKFSALASQNQINSLPHNIQYSTSTLFHYPIYLRTAQVPTLRADCDITVVDYSEDEIVMHHLDNATLPGWLEKEGKRAQWVKCRWIDVNGLSWDVIQALGKYKRLHRLAIEDLVNTRNRTKADW